MKTQINEVKRMQHLAGINEGDSDINTVNTPDEKRLKGAIEINTLMISRLNDIGDNVSELDGFFKTLLDFTSLNKVPKSTVVASLIKALKELSPESTTITTKKSNDKVN